MKKQYIAMELMIDGSRQDYKEFSKAEFKRLSEALGQAVVNYDGEDRKPFLALMKKIDRVLKIWEEQ